MFCNTAVMGQFEVYSWCSFLCNLMHWLSNDETRLFMDGYLHRNMVQLFLIAHWGYMIHWIKPSSIPGWQINVTADRCHWQMIQLED